MKIRALLEQSGKTAVGFSVPEDVVLALGKGKRPPVNVTINGYTYRSTVAPMGGGYMVGVSAENRAAAGVKGGETHDIELTLDTEPREVELPADANPRLPIEVDRPGGLWALVRRSATEPVVRVTVEGPDEDAVRALHEELRSELL